MIPTVKAVQLTMNREGIRDLAANQLKLPTSPFAFAKSLDEGVLIRPIGNTVYVMPPYVLSTQETEQMGQAVQRALNRALNG